MNVKGKLMFTGPDVQSTELGGVTLWECGCHFHLWTVIICAHISLFVLQQIISLLTKFLIVVCPLFCMIIITLLFMECSFIM